ncbi:MAG: hypothetical protein WDW38_006399 [Sanguina aurantia]
MSVSAPVAPMVLEVKEKECVVCEATGHKHGYGPSKDLNPAVKLVRDFCKLISRDTDTARRQLGIASDNQSLANDRALMDMYIRMHNLSRVLAPGVKLEFAYGILEYVTTRVHNHMVCLGQCKGHGHGPASEDKLKGTDTNTNTDTAATIPLAHWDILGDLLY